MIKKQITAERKRSMHSSENLFRRTAEFTVSDNEDGLTAGDVLRLRGVSRRLTVKLKRRENGITLNGVQTRTVDRVRAGDILAVALDGGSSLEANPSLTVPVAYEDEDVIVFDKPDNMPVHPSAGHYGDTLGNCFGAMFPGLTFRPVNRLDKNTSGLCAVAKNAYAAKMLGGNMEKEYLAAACGTVDGCGRIEAPIGRADGGVIKREVRSDGQYAATNYTIIKENGKYTLLRVVPETGRTHQIRVHFAYIGHPLAGDELYGGDTSDIGRHALHCCRLGFVSPISGKKVVLESPMREDIKRLFE